MRGRALLVGFLLLVVAPDLAARTPVPVAPAGLEGSWVDAQTSAPKPLSRRFQAFKTDVVEATGIGKNGLHLLLGGLAFVVCALLLARITRQWAWWAGGLTLALALLLELMDWRDATLVGKRLTLGHALKDVLLTCAVATLFLAGRPVYKRLRGRLE